MESDENINDRNEEMCQNVGVANERATMPDKMGMVSAALSAQDRRLFKQHCTTLITRCIFALAPAHTRVVARHLYFK
jgi:hypothetical protein